MPDQELDQQLREQLALLRRNMPHVPPHQQTNARIIVRKNYDKATGVNSFDVWWEGGDLAGVSGDVIQDAAPGLIRLAGNNRFEFAGGLTVEIIGYDPFYDVFYVKQVAD